MILHLAPQGPHLRRRAPPDVTPVVDDAPVGGLDEPQKSAARACLFRSRSRPRAPWSRRAAPARTRHRTARSNCVFRANSPVRTGKYLVSFSVATKVRGAAVSSALMRDFSSPRTRTRSRSRDLLPDIAPAGCTAPRVRRCPLARARALSPGKRQPRADSDRRKRQTRWQVVQIGPPCLRWWEAARPPLPQARMLAMSPWVYG